MCNFPKVGTVLLKWLWLCEKCMIVLFFPWSAAIERNTVGTLLMRLIKHQPLQNDRVRNQNDIQNVYRL